MRILYVCADHGVPILGRRGCSTHVRETCHALRQGGHELLLLCSMRGKDEAAGEGLEIVEVPPPRSRKLGYDLRNLVHNRKLLRRGCELMRERRIDAIYERFSLYSTAGTRLSRRFHVPRILEVNAFLSVEHRKKIHCMPLARAMERWVVRRAPQIIVVSQPLKDDLVGMGVHEDRVTIMPMGVDLDHFRPGPDAAGKVRRDWGLEGKYVIGYVGALSGWHGISLLYEMAEKIRAVRQDFAFFVVGGSAQKVEDHRRRVREAGLEEQLIFTGSVSYQEVPSYIGAMDVAMVPDTNYWTCPTKMFEYQASGIPTIAPRYPAVLRAMDDGVEGLLFEPRNVDEAVEKILSVADAPDERLAMGERAWRRVAATRSWETNVRQIERIYEDLRDKGLC